MKSKLKVLTVVVMMFVMLISTTMVANAYVITCAEGFYTRPIVMYAHTNMTSSHITALNNAINTWNNAGKGTLFVYGGVKAVPFPGVRDGLNGVTLSAMGTGRPIAVTRISYDTSGVIYEGNIDVNISYNYIFSPGAANGYDAQTMYTHELGHVLGLGESNVAGSVMSQPQVPNSFLRALTSDDIAGLNAIY